MFPHERSLVTRLAGKPFVLLGINAGDDPEVVRKQESDGTINWRNFQDAKGAEGPISEQWQVNSFPVIYIIDAKGVVRYIDPQNKGGMQAIDDAIETLLEEMGEQFPAG